jgi:hypothetical protein
MDAYGPNENHSMRGCGRSPASLASDSLSFTMTWSSTKNSTKCRGHGSIFPSLVTTRRGLRGSTPLRPRRGDPGARPRAWPNDHSRHGYVPVPNRAPQLRRNPHTHRGIRWLVRSRRMGRSRHHAGATVHRTSVRAARWREWIVEHRSVRGLLLGRARADLGTFASARAR